MEQSENASTRFDWLFSHTPAIVPLTLILPFFFFLCLSVTLMHPWMDIYQDIHQLSVINFLSLSTHPAYLTSLYYETWDPSCPPLHL